MDANPKVNAGIRTVAVVGGGTAGYFAALALKRRFPQFDVTLIESSSIPIIGVGEATTTLMPPFLHIQLGLDIVEFYEAVRPTWKLGIKFDWGLPGDYSFNYPFGQTHPIEAQAFDGHLQNQSLTAMLMAADRSPIIATESGEPLSLLTQAKFAYHLDNKPFVAYLAKKAVQAGIHHVDARIDDVRTSPDGENVEGLRLDDGRELRFDLYVDASGFRSVLMEKALGSPFESYASSLFCDTAIVASVPHGGLLQPYTLAQSMNAGWCWKIPVEDENHRGYVFSSAFITEDEARAEMRAKNPGLGDTWTVRFRSGRHRDFWKGNTVAVGNAYGFVEPLESTALHMVIIETAYLVGCLEAAGEGEPDRAYANKNVGAHWDFLRWFLALHYKFNQKLDTPFWRAARQDVNVDGIEPLLERFRSVGPWINEGGTHFQTGDPAFGYHGIMILLLGQQAPCPPPPLPAFPREKWEARAAEARALAERAMSQTDALALLRQRPELLREVVTARGSWVVRGAESVAVNPKSAPIQPRSFNDPCEPWPYHHLFEGLR